MLLVLLITFLDGTNINVSVPADTKWELKTPYGNLSIPLADFLECEFGVHVKDETVYTNAVKALGVEDYKTRDAATKFLRKDLRSAYKFIYDKTGENIDGETSRRAELLLKELGYNPVLHDTVKLKNSIIQGEITAKSFTGKSDVLGELAVDICKIKTLRVKTPMMKVKVKYGTWVNAGFVSGSLKIKASGTLDLYPTNPGVYTCNPDGHGQTTVGDYLPGALIGRVNGKTFLVGSSLDVASMETGRLELFINRSLWAGEVSGEYIVEVE